VRITEELEGLRAPGQVGPALSVAVDDDEDPRRGRESDGDSNPGRVLLRDDRAPTVTARTTRIAAPRNAAAPPVEEAIITKDGGEEDESASKGEPLPDVKIPELTDDEEVAEAPPSSVTGATHLNIPVDTQTVSSLLSAARGAYEKGDLQKAIQLLTDALDMQSDLAETYINRGQCHLDLGDYSSAMSDFQKAEDLEPNKPEPHFAMGNLYFNRKEYKRAIEFYDQALEMNGQHAMARCRRGISYYYRKNYRQAFHDLQAAFRLDPEIPNIRKYVQMAMKKMDKPD
jgi:TolA-binding protein